MFSISFIKNLSVLHVQLHADITIQFFPDASQLTVVEGVDQYAYFQLVLSDVPSGGLEGVIEFSVVIAPSGASKCFIYHES